MKEILYQNDNDNKPKDTSILRAEKCKNINSRGKKRRQTFDRNF